jgi:type IV pilus assembly protein PilM
LVAAVAENIEQIISTLSKVKVRAHAVDLTAFGLARATASLVPPDQAVATVSIGDHTTQIVISRGGVPLFVRLLPVDVATAATLRRGTELAEPALEFATAGAAGNRGGASNTGPTRGAIRSATPPGASDLAARVRSTLAFFGSRPVSLPLTRVFVTGAGAAVEGVMTALTASIDVPLTVVGVSDVIPMSTPAPAGEVALNLVGTVGVALGEAGR